MELTAAILRSVLARDLGVPESSIEVFSFSISPGSNKGDNFVCDIKAVEVEYRVSAEKPEGEQETEPEETGSKDDAQAAANRDEGAERRSYMAKVFPENARRIDFLKEVRYRHNNFLTDSFTFLEPQHQEIGEFSVNQERRGIDFEATKL